MRVRRDQHPPLSDRLRDTVDIARVSSEEILLIEQHALQGRAMPCLDIYTAPPAAQIGREILVIYPVFRARHIVHESRGMPLHYTCILIEVANGFVADDDLSSGIALPHQLVVDRQRTVTKTAC